MKFKTDRIRSEWESNKVDSTLKDIILCGEDFAKIAFKKDLTITDLIRTQEEQDKIYSYSDKYKEKPWKSVHQFGRGVDLRTHDFTDKEIDRLEQFFNNFIYDPIRPGKKTCTVHKVGSGALHFHIQVM